MNLHSLERYDVEFLSVVSSDMASKRTALVKYETNTATYLRNLHPLCQKSTLVFIDPLEVGQTPDC